MTRKVLIVAALLLTGHASIAAAAEIEEKQASKKAAKVIATLEMLGLDNKRVINLIKEADQHIEGNKVMLADEELMGGRVRFTYKLGSHIGTRQFELRYVPSHESRYSYTVSKEAIMLNYRYKIDY